MTAIYFAEDGNYGKATGIVIVDTARWSDEDWDKLESVSDWQKPYVAREIAAGY